MTDTKNDIATLNALLSTVVDSIEGFEQASEGVEDPRIVAAFHEVVAERRAIVGDLEREIRSLGGEPDETGSILGAAHHLLIRIRDALSSGDTAVVDEAERGEDYLKGKFETAAGDDDLDPRVRATVAGLCARVVAGHDRIRNLKQTLHG